MTERRTKKRLLCADLVRVDWRVRTLEGVLEDISPQGACVQLDEPIPPGEAMSISRPAADDALFQGLVTYCVRRDCGFLVQWPMPDAVRLLEAYGAVEDPLYLAEKENRYLTFRRALGLLGPPDGRRLLDVGAYCGIFVDVARQAGFAAEGIELSRWAVREARALGLPVRNETLVEAARTGARYDVLTLWDVIEHLADPRQELLAAAELLRPGGEIHVSTIDAASLLARVLGARWPWLMDMHVVYFDRRTLPRLLGETGFRVVRRRAYTHTVSADYLLRKAGASFPALSPLFRLARRLVPGRLPVPVNLGDNMVVTAVRR